ncbi:hypothetical protein EJ05DRAFT_449284 [Pseudovirgaria hyperparasitica]|uniref:TPR-like protein n=1 Tax=Pseudovirgaria hyperparasitica TaxID=470096 RepID=A0A6A6WEP0_9PEZI|nr:uncharacterized protein EJ05DRAFT_449284 [Pseudovirgaria hyperparasitica]KAF2761005.1 hypothetical protein EJ05DRAFT_449284 [Pseudovirgaria hyperparasitica]
MSTDRGHGHNPSHDERRRVAMPRRTTLGPLDADTDDPLAGSTIDTSAPRFSQPEPISRSQIASPAQDSTTPTSALDDVPSKDLSFLLDPSIYHPLPTSAVPQPFLNSLNASDINDSLTTLLSRGQYRLAALHCARELCAIRDPTSVTTILNLFHTRLACLTLLSHHDLAATESKALGDLTSSFYRHPVSGTHYVPWSLRVLCIRLTALGYSEWRKGIMGYYELAREARSEIARASATHNDNAATEEWSARLRELGVLTANLLVEMGDLEAAAEHLASLPGYTDAEDAEAVRLRTYEALLWLRVGDIAAARRTLPASQPPSHLTALLQISDDDFDSALSTLQALRKSHSKDPMIGQNLAVCRLYVGQMSAAREVLEDLVDQGHAFHTLTFNLATLYELSTERAREKKGALADRVAGRKPRDQESWERANVDFKL